MCIVKMKNKRGISPLVATVLLVAIVIIIAILLWFWYHQFIEEQQQKASTELAQACMDAEIRIESETVCSGSEIKVELSNIGSSQITSVLINAIYSDTSESFESGWVIPPGTSTGLQDLGPEFSITPTQLEIIPIVMVGSTSKYCNEQAEYATCS